MEKLRAWIYRQRNYHGSAWDKFQRFIAFQFIPFVICAMLASGLTIVIMMPVVMLLEYSNK